MKQLIQSILIVEWERGERAATGFEWAPSTGTKLPHALPLATGGAPKSHVLIRLRLLPPFFLLFFLFLPSCSWTRGRGCGEEEDGDEYREDEGMANKQRCHFFFAGILALFGYSGQFFQFFFLCFSFQVKMFRFWI